MYKKFLIVFLFVISSCTVPTIFTEQALNDSFIDLRGDSIQLKNILKKYKGNKVLINVWASWCRDCVVGFQKLQEFQKEHSNVKYVLISSDRNGVSWKKAIEKYGLKGDHYFMSKGMDSEFGTYLNSNWIPRYLVVNESGFVDLFKAKSIIDPRIAEALKK